MIVSAYSQTLKAVGNTSLCCTIAVFNFSFFQKVDDDLNTNFNAVFQVLGQRWPEKIQQFVKVTPSDPSFGQLTREGFERAKK